MIQYIPEQSAFLFPGQGSQALGMGSALAQTYPEAMSVFDRADEVLGYPLTQICWNDPQSQLNDTIYTQPALLTHSIAALKVFQQHISDQPPRFLAGHSMGEITALVAANSLSFEDGLLLAHHRGRVMKKSGEENPGGMAAILGLEIDTLNELCQKIRQTGEPVQVANDNCPGQIVISGSHQGVDQVIELARANGAKKAIKLAVSIPAHSALMESAQIEFKKIVDEIQILPPIRPIVGNVCRIAMTAPVSIKNDIISQLVSPVYWTQSIQYMIANGVHTFIELGSGTVLSGLVKRINNQVQTISLGTPQDYEQIAAV